MRQQANYMISLLLQPSGTRGNPVPTSSHSSPLYVQPSAAGVGAISALVQHKHPDRNVEHAGSTMFDKVMEQLTAMFPHHTRFILLKDCSCLFVCFYYQSHILWVILWKSVFSGHIWRNLFRSSVLPVVEHWAACHFRRWLEEWHSWSWNIRWVGVQHFPSILIFLKVIDVKTAVQTWSDLFGEQHQGRQQVVYICPLRRGRTPQHWLVWEVWLRVLLLLLLLSGKNLSSREPYRKKL